MRILSVHMNSTLNVGAELGRTHSNRLLAERGHSIAWLGIGIPQDALARGEPVFSLPELPDEDSRRITQIPRHFYNPAAFRLAKRAIQEFHPDIVRVHTVFGYRYLTPAVLLPFRECGIPIIQTLHDYGLICPASFFLSSNQICEACKGGKYYSVVLRRCRGGSFFKSCAAALNAYLKDYAYHYDSLITGYIAPSQFLRQKYIEFGVAPEKIDVVPNAYFLPGTPDKTGVPKRQNFILFAGRLSYEKGVDTLIKAVEDLDVQVKIAGDGEERENLESLVKASGSQKIKFLGKLPHTEMGALYQQAACVVIPSRSYENSPTVILEAFSYATPVIAARIGALPEFVIDGYSGLLFNVDDPVDLRQVIQSALDDPIRLAGMAAQAYQSVQAGHAPEVHAARLEAVLERHYSRSKKPAINNPGEGQL